VHKTKKFIDRPAEMKELEEHLLPSANKRQKIFVLRGLGGIGKTQLAVEFIRRHHKPFSSVFWLDGNSNDSLKRSLADCASRIQADQLSDNSRVFSKGGGEGRVTTLKQW
jgi:AAA+ ATPase superfamily predicted ATPase